MAQAGGPFSPAVLGEFDAHSERIRARARARQEAVRMRSVVNDTDQREVASEEDALGRRMPQDEWQGDTNLRTLRALLKMIDERGYERCAAAHPAAAAPTPDSTPLPPRRPDLLTK